jgi:hypothetical protein
VTLNRYQICHPLPKIRRPMDGSAADASHTSVTSGVR